MPLLVAIATLALTSVPASALNTHAFSTHFGSSGSGAGELSLQAVGNAVAGSGVAISSVTHDIYVADTGNARVDEFNSSGEFILMFGKEVNKTKVEGGLASEAEQDVCTEVEVELGAECQKGVSGSGPGQFTTPVFVAVDNSAGPSASDVYVGDTGDNLVSKFSSGGAAIESWGSKSQLNGETATSPPGAVAGPFGPLAGIAVDSTGTLDVFEEEPHGLFQFAQDGTFITSFETVRGTFPRGLAVDSTGNFFKVNGDASVEEINASGGDVGQVTPNESEGTSAAGIVADGTDLYLVELGAVKHYAFNGSGEVVEPGGATCPVRPNPEIAPGFGCQPTDSFGSGAESGGSLTGGSGVGVDPSSGDVYVADASANRLDVFLPVVLPDVKTSEATKIGPTSATLNGTVNPDGVEVTDCHFDYGTTTAYGQTAACEQAVGSGPGEVAVTAKITGLTPGTTYHFRLQAENAAGIPSLGSDARFSPPPPPAITGESASSLTASSADLNARVNPGGLPVTSCRFEYGTTTEYAQTKPCEPQPGAGTSPVAVTTHLAGLYPNTTTTYHWRVVATNEAGTTTGPDHTFVYPESGGGLPDNRAYEMVTPPQKNGALIGDIQTSAVPSIAEDGSRVILSSFQCFPGAPSCVPVHEVSTGAQYAFSRSANGWSPAPFQSPATEFGEGGWLLYNADTDTALLNIVTAPHGEDDFYAHSPGAGFADLGPITPPSEGLQSERVQSMFGLASSDDLSHIVFELAASLEEYTSLDRTKPVPVGVSGGLGSNDFIGDCGIKLGYQPELGTTSTAMSADGRVVYFSVEACGSGTGANEGKPVPALELFARVDNAEAGAHTVAISEPQAPEVPAEAQGDCTGALCREDTSNAHEGNWRRAEFQGASSDGSKAFFTSVQQLTDGASEGPKDEGDCIEAGGTGCNLYLYDSSRPEGHRLVDVSAGDTSGGGPRVQAVTALSSDGSHVYFEAKGVLTAAANSRGQTAQSGAENLYVYTEGRTSFITTLPELREGDPATRFLNKGPGRPMNVTPDGRFLVFTSSGALTADATRSDGADQVYRYDAQAGQLLRLSIGEQGFNDNGNGGAGDALIVPGFKGWERRIGAGRPDPTMSNDGNRVFFMSPVALTPGALSSVRIGTRPNTVEPAYAENVYEYHEGTVSLISDGRDASTAPGDLCEPNISSVCLIGTDNSGANVFFSTVDQLVPADTDTQLDFYDARICEPENANPCVTPAPPPLPPCQGEACHGTPPATPSGLTPGSATFNGAGNLAPPPPAGSKPLSKAQKLAKALKACRKDKNQTKRRGCERQARKRFGPPKGKRASTKRRAS